MKSDFDIILKYSSIGLYQFVITDYLISIHLIMIIALISISLVTRFSININVPILIIIYINKFSLIFFLNCFIVTSC